MATPNRRRSPILSALHIGGARQLQPAAGVYEASSPEVNCPSGDVSLECRDQLDPVRARSLRRLPSTPAP